MRLAPVGQPLKVVRQALACRLRLGLQCLRLVQVALEKGCGASPLGLITPLGVQIHADNWEWPSGKFG
jgi:hypothetical protein